MQPYLKRLRESNDSSLWWRIRALTTLPGLLLIFFGVPLSAAHGRVLWWAAIVLFGFGLFGETILQVLWARDYDREKARAAVESGADGN